MTRRIHRAERRWTVRVAVAVVAIALTSCATRNETIVLLPEKDGHDAAVVVRHGDTQSVLDKPYAAAQVDRTGTRTYVATPAEVERLFGPALAAQPARPARFTLYFVDGTDRLTEESARMFDSVLAEIARNAVPDIVVVGHTDRVGSDAANDVLARQRADTVRAALLQRGIAPDSVAAEGRGEREPLVPTADGVAEPRNRRVEIVVR
jgi:outer membrane protein OmpA-like peptidoglycan-associated protein